MFSVRPALLELRVQLGHLSRCASVRAFGKFATLKTFRIFQARTLATFRAVVYRELTGR